MDSILTLRHPFYRTLLLNLLLLESKDFFGGGLRAAFLMGIVPTAQIIIYAQLPLSTNFRGINATQLFHGFVDTVAGRYFHFSPVGVNQHNPARGD